MKTHLWKIANSKIDKTNLYLYSNFIEKKYEIESKNDFNKIWKWSIDNLEDFWRSGKAPWQL